MSVLYALSGDLAKSTNVWQSADAAARHMKLAFAVPCAIILESRGGIERYPVNVAASSEMKTKETAVAEWVIRNGRQAGRFTDTLLDAPARFVPMVTQGGVVGAARIELSAPLDPTGESLLQTMVDQAALSIERHRLAQREQELRMADESDRLSRILMNTVSHELRSPLTAIMGASSALLDESVAQNPEVRRGLLDELWNSAARLNRLVNNLLDMSRLESGHMRIRHFPVSLHDVVEECLATYKRDLEGHNVVTDLAGMTGTISADYELLVQAVGCVIHNAAVHTPAGTSIFIKAGTSALDQAWLTVEDDGSGVSDEEIAGLFDRFYGGRRTRGTGAGLGLSLAKGIFELHGGSLTAERRQPHGLRFSARVPATQPSRQAGAGGDQT